MSVLRPLLAVAALVAAPHARASGKVFFGSGAALFRGDTDGTDVRSIAGAIGAPLTGLAVDAATRQVYLSAVGAGIFQVSLEGGAVTGVVPGRGGDFLAVDVVHDRLCFVDGAGLTCGDSLGDNLRLLEPANANTIVGQVAVDTATGEVYWAVVQQVGPATRCEIRFPLGTTLSQTCNGTGRPQLAIDAVARRLVARFDADLVAVDLDGSDFVDLPDPAYVSHALSIDPLEGRVFLDNDGLGLHSIRADGTGDTRLLDAIIDGSTAVFQPALLGCTVVDDGVTATLRCSDGTTAIIDDGSDGAPGIDGDDGAPGIDGVDGVDGAPGVDGDDGAAGADGGCASTPALAPWAVLALLWRRRRQGSSDPDRRRYRGPRSRP